MDIVNLLITLVGGAIGGNVAGPATQDKNLGAIANTISGLIGGPLGSYILQALGLLGAATATDGAITSADVMDWSALLKNLAAGGGGGAILTALLTYAKSAMGK